MILYTPVFRSNAGLLVFTVVAVAEIAALVIIGKTHPDLPPRTQKLLGGAAVAVFALLVLFLTE